MAPRWLGGDGLGYGGSQGAARGIGPLAEGRTIVRDVAEQQGTVETEERRLAEEQAALRRVATLVARDPPPELVFQSVTEEVCTLLGLRTAVLHRFDDERTSTIVGKFGEPTGHFDLGNVVVLEGTALRVLQTGAPARSHYADLPGPGAAELRALGFHDGVGVPIRVADATWGALVVALREDETLPVKTEHRLYGFAELVGLAVASAQARDELAASRRRIVTAGDAERRRIERNLHDGAQQRLVALSVGLRLAAAEDPLRSGRGGGVAGARVRRAAKRARGAARARARHPPRRADRPRAGPALDVLSARVAIRVTLDVNLPERLPDAIEAAAYYVVSEALANVVKHAAAGTTHVAVMRTTDGALVEVRDDGKGGADLDRGTGLCGLRDRVEALDGGLEITSAPGYGTRVRAVLPLP